MRVFLGFGSNKGNRLSYLNRACKLIDECDEIEILKCSSVYETEPWGFSNQNMFLNAIAEAETSLEPGVLLKKLKSIEKALERSANVKWAEREIDIDLLFYGDQIIESEGLSIPHKQIENRNFVLIPLVELEPEFMHPVIKRTVHELLKISPDKLKVHKTEHKLY
ncbi:MAG: 2-amino-4-hydroxy-6-hydroxymethyldihydropteridine diphosphokinase [Ignavibacteriaceae bacterium]|jgi:2-amino-4-hydroxy-6-hydroxymethyldihydropteridine pyrophosphokinase|nr:MAG: 2-amino-4-hydroxy-6-hydroxymethyldihydropteridine diphosphokinase [Chlorobiota bacterium]KXK01809.1 MAG: 7, 8-Dihydro-6-hydroxymethylpterin-pyrophosphokinase [Chlorobi bacterium OLB4]MBV6399322.1 Bifunctional folate synthesis protein [Ignavibacteria bacterium]MCC6886766.1 2-amino-4-hydroxy-6-hydroxymethyldihydropteridine diphosphokinase [Ignavibacteriales bacterium]MCE7953703.1 2-amino-4-hydroxy-6-hydroxymethyldihydropteridine diphosphokinase [Chlorobi bacterium CHB7]MDL1887638.1 2-ami